jgi:hypothetical protein
MDIVTGFDHQPILPGVVISEYGKGKVIYCSSALEAIYDYEGAAVVGKLIEKFVNTIAVEPAPYSLNAPAGLLANLTKKENKMVLHLTNWTGNKFEKPWRNEYYLGPVENVHLQIRIPPGKKVKGVSTLIEAEYDKKITGQNLKISFPRIQDYQAVIVELE